jgi:hypothetical protein
VVEKHYVLIRLFFHRSEVTSRATVKGAGRGGEEAGILRRYQMIDYR